MFLNLWFLFFKIASCPYLTDRISLILLEVFNKLKRKISSTTPNFSISSRVSCLFISIFLSFVMQISLSFKNQSTSRGNWKLCTHGLHFRDLPTRSWISCKDKMKRTSHCKTNSLTSLYFCLISLEKNPVIGKLAISQSICNGWQGWWSLTSLHDTSSFSLISAFHGTCGLSGVLLQQLFPHPQVFLATTFCTPFSHSALFQPSFGFQRLMRLVVCCCEL